MNMTLDEILASEWEGEKYDSFLPDEISHLTEVRAAQTLRYLEFCRKQGFKRDTSSSLRGQVISLDGSPRRTAFELNAQRAGVNFSYFNAVNGFSDALDVFDLDVWGLEKMPTHWEGNRGHMACTLSHLSLYKQIFDSGLKDDWYLVLEDDCYFHPYFSEALNLVLEKANSHAQDIDVICLSNRASHWLSKSENFSDKLTSMDFVFLDDLTEEVTLARRLGYAKNYSPKQTRVFGTEAILFSANAMKKLKALAEAFGGKVLGEYLGAGPFGIEAILQHHLGRSPSKSAFDTPPQLIEGGFVSEGKPYMNSCILTLPLTTTRDWLGEQYFSETRRKRVNQKR